MRTGPKPLPVHLGLCVMTGLRAGMSYAENERQLQGFLAGVRKYHLYPREKMSPGDRRREQLPEIWREGEVSLRRIFPPQWTLHKNRDKNAPQCKSQYAPLLLVPSLINGAQIFDLLPQRSFARWLAAQEPGREVYILDWGRPLLDPALNSVTGIVTQRLGPAVKSLLKTHGRPIDALGYCMGGTLLAAAASAGGLRPHLRSLTLMAAPWDFHKPSDDMRTKEEVAKEKAGQADITAPAGIKDLIKAFLPMALPALYEEKRLSGAWLQSVFAALEPAQAIRKFTAFSGLAEGDPKADLFVALEDWLNDCHDLPGDLAQECFRDWYGLNLPACGTWRIERRAVAPDKLDLPCALIVARRDRLVPLASSLALKVELPHAQVFEADCGHVGLIGSEGIEKDLWMPFEKWLSGVPA